MQVPINEVEILARISPKEIHKEPVSLEIKEPTINPLNTPIVNPAINEPLSSPKIDYPSVERANYLKYAPTQYRSSQVHKATS